MFSKRRSAVLKRRQRRKSVGRAVVGGAPTAVGAGVGMVAAPLGPVAGLAGSGSKATTRRFLSLVRLDRVFMTSLERVGQRERERAELAFASATKTIVDRLDGGEVMRGDGFFNSDEQNPSDAEEIFEGVIRAACEDHERRKAERLGELYAFVAFNPQISAGHANHLLELARSLTYEQLLLLGIFATEDNRAPDWASTGGISWTSLGVVMSIFDLGQAGLIVREDGRPLLSFTDINPVEVRTALNGTILTEAMNLKEAPQADLEAVLNGLDRLGKTVLGEGKDPDVEHGQERIRLDDLPEPRFPLTEFLASRNQQ